MITSFRSGIDTFENEYRIRIQHFSIITFLSFDTFDNPTLLELLNLLWYWHQEGDCT